ncbi:hypothetical protein TNCV_730651 [Trichonephila clavipes]|nr:hypothetical protein TNCV_730651 [Trichonephila clavipes]
MSGREIIEARCVCGRCAPATSEERKESVNPQKLVIADDLPNTPEAHGREALTHSVLWKMTQQKRDFLLADEYIF